MTRFIKLLKLTGKKLKRIKTLMNLIISLCKKFFYYLTISRERDKGYKKDLKSPWITTEIRKSSKHKQHLYKKFLKNQNSLN